MNSFDNKNINLSNIINKFLQTIFKNKIALLIIILFSFAYSFYIKNSYQATYQATAIINTYAVIERDVLKEVIHDYFKIQINNNKNCIQYHKLREKEDSKNKFYLDIITNTKQCSKNTYDSLLNFIKINSIVLKAVKYETTRLVYLDSSLKNKTQNTSDTTNYIYYLKKLAENKIKKEYLSDYNPIQKSFSLPTTIENIKLIFIKSFFKALFSGLALLLFFDYLKSTLKPSIFRSSSKL